jgi:hypothetical protein
MTRGSQKRAPRTRKAPVYHTAFRMALALPGTEEGFSYGTPACRVAGKLFARLREDGETLVVRTSFEEREVLMRKHPKVFHLTDHYLHYPWVLVRLSVVGNAMLRDVLERAWRRRAPPRLVAAFDGRR